MNDFKFPRIAAAFPVFCQKILPLAFDNAESYLEFVAHINAKLNEVICAVNETNIRFCELTQRIDTTFAAFKTEIENTIETNNEEIYNAIDELEDALKEDINGLDERLTDVEHDVESISGDIDDIQGDIETMQGDIDNIENQLENISGNVDFDVISTTGDDITNTILNATACIYKLNDMTYEKVNAVSLADYISGYNFNVGSIDSFAVVFNDTDLNGVTFYGGGVLESPYSVSGNDVISQSTIETYGDNEIVITDIAENATQICNVDSTAGTVDNFSGTFGTSANYTVITFSQIVFNSIVAGIADFATGEKFVQLKDKENVKLYPKILIDESLSYENGVLHANIPYVYGDSAIIVENNNNVIVGELEVIET